MGGREGRRTEGGGGRTGGRGTEGRRDGGRDGQFLCDVDGDEHEDRHGKTYEHLAREKERVVGGGRMR